MNAPDMNTMPKSYLSPEEREKYLGRDNMDSLYSAESQAADDAGDGDTAWAWLAKIELPAYTLLGIKRNHGAQFIRDMGFLTKEADAEYGADWLDR